MRCRLAIGPQPGVCLERLAGSAPRPAAQALQAHWQEQGAQHAITLLLRFYRLNCLNERTFRRLLEAMPNSLMQINHALAYPAVSRPRPRRPGLLQSLRRLTDTVLWEMLCDLRPESWQTLHQVRDLSGGRFLLRLAEEVERQGIARLTGSSSIQVRYSLRDCWTSLQHLPAARGRRQRETDRAAAPGEPPPSWRFCPTRARTPPSCVPRSIGPAARRSLRCLIAFEDGWPASSTDPTSGVLRRQDVPEIAAAMDENAHPNAA